MDRQAIRDKLEFLLSISQNSAVKCFGKWPAFPGVPLLEVKKRRILVVSAFLCPVEKEKFCPRS